MATAAAQTPENPRAVPGDNQAPDYAKRVTDEMAANYGALGEAVTSLLADAKAHVPDAVETEDHNKIVAGFIVKMRDTNKRINDHREREKAPYLRGGQAVDQFFNSLGDRIDKAMRIIQARGDDYTRRKIALERAERERLAREAAAEAARLRAEEETKRREAEELAAAADRARKPENIAKLEEAAEAIAAEATTTRIDALMAGDQADLARNAALASSADIARTRFDTGHMATAKQVPHVEITDPDALDKNLLWPFIKEADKLSALKAWAKTTSHKKPMDGAIIEMRDKGDYR